MSTSTPRIGRNGSLRSKNQYTGCKFYALGLLLARGLFLGRKEIEGKIQNTEYRIQKSEEGNQERAMEPWELQAAPLQTTSIFELLA
jgi:hypothetical protein